MEAGFVGFWTSAIPFHLARTWGTLCLNQDAESCFVVIGGRIRCYRIPEFYFWFVLCSSRQITLRRLSKTQMSGIYFPLTSSNIKGLTADCNFSESFPYNHSVSIFSVIPNKRWKLWGFLTWNLISAETHLQFKFWDEIYCMIPPRLLAAPSCCESWLG